MSEHLLSPNEEPESRTTSRVSSWPFRQRDAVLRSVAVTPRLPFLHLALLAAEISVPSSATMRR